MQLQLTLPKLEVHQITDRFENIPHSHDRYYQLTIATRGRCHFTYENRPFTLSPGEALLLHPSDKHWFRLGEDAGVVIAMVEAGDLFADSSPYRDEPVLRSRVEPHRVQDYFRRWMHSALFRDAGSMAAEQEEEEAILGDIRKLWGTDAAGNPVDRIAEERGAGGGDRHMARALDYLREHYTEQLSVDDLAAVALQSRFHFIRSFKAFTGFTPYQYMLHLRMEEAKRLLLNTSSTVTEISYRLGFSAPSQFYRLFERTFRATPEQYRGRS